MSQKNILMVSGLLIMAALAILPVVTGAQTVVSPDTYFVVHENPSNVSLWANPDVSYKMDVLMQKMFINTFYVAAAINRSDYAGANVAYEELLGTNEAYIDLLYLFNISDPQYYQLQRSADSNLKDVKIIIDNSENYHWLYQNYTRYLNEGNNVEAFKTAIELRNAYSNISTSRQSLTSNSLVLINSINKTNFFTAPMEQAQENFANYSIRLDERQKGVDSLLSSTNLTLGTSGQIVPVGGNVTFTSVLTGEDGKPVAYSTIVYYVNGKRAGQAITDANGVYQFTYNISQNSAKRLDVYTVYQPGNTSLVPAYSNNVIIDVLPEKTSLSLVSLPDSVSYGDAIYLSGNLSSKKGQVIPGRTIELYLNDQYIGSTLTNRDGIYTYVYGVNDTTPSGVLAIQGVFEPGDDDVYLSSVSRNVTTTVQEQGTNLLGTTGVSRYLAGDNILINGSVTTTGGVPVSGVNITIYLGDTALVTCETSADGVYGATVPVPFYIEPGNYDLHASYKPTNSSLTGSRSERNHVTLDSSAPQISVSGVPAVLFAGDTLDLTGSIVTINNRSVPGKELIISTPYRELGSVLSENNGSYILSYRIGYNDSPGIYNISAAAESGGLLSGSTVTAGNVVIIPYDKVPIVLLLGVIVIIILAFISVITGYDQRALTYIRYQLKIFRETEPIIIYDAAVPAIPAQPPAVPNVTLDPDLTRLSASIASKNFKEAIIDLYITIRKIITLYGVNIPDSQTHREFLCQLSARYPSLSRPLQAIIDQYEAVCFGMDSVGEQEVLDSIRSLKEVESVLSKNVRGGGR